MYVETDAVDGAHGTDLAAHQAAADWEVNLEVPDLDERLCGRCCIVGDAHSSSPKVWILRSSSARQQADVCCGPTVCNGGTPCRHLSIT